MKKPSLNAFQLKIIAIVSMGLQHTLTSVLWKFILLGLAFPLYAIRGITFPIMAFFAAEGFKRTTDVKKYMWKLFVFASISQIPYFMLFGSDMMPYGMFMLNIIFTIFLGVVVLALYDKLYVKFGKKWQFACIVTALAIVSFVGPYVSEIAVLLEGGIFASIYIFVIYIIKDERKRQFWPAFVWGFYELFSILFSQPPFIPPEMLAKLPSFLDMYAALAEHFFVFFIGPFIAAFLLLAYNGERGKKAKYLFYTFYPLHLIILSLFVFLLS